MSFFRKSDKEDSVYKYKKDDNEKYVKNLNNKIKDDIKSDNANKKDNGRFK
jgi:hypothetical protein